MKRAIIIISIIIVLATGSLFITKKITGATKLDFDIGEVDFPVSSLIEFKNFLTSGAESDIEIILMNYSNERYTIDNVSIYLKALDGTTVAYQTVPLSQPVTIEPNSNNSLILPLYIKGAIIFKIAQQLGINNNVIELWSMVKNYFTTGKFGTSLMVTGFASKGMFKLPINFEKQI